MANHDIKCHDLLSRAKENFIDVSNKEKLSPKNGNMSPYMPKFFFYRLITKGKLMLSTIMYHTIIIETKESKLNYQ